MYYLTILKSVLDVLDAINSANFKKISKESFCLKILACLFLIINLLTKMQTNFFLVLSLCYLTIEVAVKDQSP